MILVAPPGRHLAVSEGHARLLAGPAENGHRPSADVLLRSAADAFGAACCGIVLSGTMDDGAAGLAAVRRSGGLALVQDPAEAGFSGMPRAAIEQADPQLVAPLSELADRVCAWLAERASSGAGESSGAGNHGVAAGGKRQAKLLREVIGDLVTTGSATLPEGDPDGDPA